MPTTIYRVLPSEVNDLAGLPSSFNVIPYLATAHLLVDAIEALNNPCMNAELLAVVETWLAAHFARLISPSITSKSIAGASTSWEGSASGYGLELTRFGQQAMLLDCTGYLNDLNDKKPQATMDWLGTTYWVHR